MSDQTTLAVSFTDSKSCRRRYRFEPRTAGGYLRIEAVRRNGDWRVVGREIVADLTIVTDES